MVEVLFPSEEWIIIILLILVGPIRIPEGNCCLCFSLYYSTELVNIGYTAFLIYFSTFY